jgi:hypothetical protein
VAKPRSDWRGAVRRFFRADDAQKRSAPLFEPGQRPAAPARWRQREIERRRLPG